MGFQFTNLVDPSIRSTVDFDDVKAVASCDPPAGIALATGFRPRQGIAAVQDLCDDPGETRLTASSRTGKEVGMGQTSFRNGTLKDAHGGILTGHIGESLWPVSPIECHVRHVYSPIRARISFSV
jgi:hypothetical protein